MKTFYGTGTYTSTGVCAWTIDAESEEEALEMARNGQVGIDDTWDEQYNIPSPFIQEIV